MENTFRASEIAEFARPYINRIQAATLTEDEGWISHRPGEILVDGEVLYEGTSYLNAIDMHIDEDYVTWDLLTVCDNDADRETWVSYLAVKVTSGKVEACEWCPQRPHRFAAEYADRRAAARAWFVGWVECVDGR